MFIAVICIAVIIKPRYSLLRGCDLRPTVADTISNARAAAAVVVKVWRNQNSSRLLTLGECVGMHTVVHKRGGKNLLVGDVIYDRCQSAQWIYIEIYVLLAAGA